MKCRHCGDDLSLPLVDLGSAPPSNAYLTDVTIRHPEKWWPLRVLVCTKCWLAQTEDFTAAAELFTADYAYFSSYSTTWQEHVERYVADMIKYLGLDRESHVVEIAANDGCLLQYVKNHGIPCLGVEPTFSTAAAARLKGIEVIEDFFGQTLAEKLVIEGRRADLIVANNVLAHVPDINDFVRGFTQLLKPNGVATFEFPHLLRLMNENQFDTIYHEHFSYLSLTAVVRIFERNGLMVFDAEELPTHGGSLRVFAQSSVTGKRLKASRLAELLQREAEAGMLSVAYYAQFQSKTIRVKNEFLAFLLEAERKGKSVVAYGAAAKGNTLINYAGVRSDLISFVVDRNPAKLGKYMPGSRIPIVNESRLIESKPEYVLILPWNLKSEIMHQLGYIRDWGARFVTAVPTLRITE